ncbi:methyltransferase type 11 [Mucilaginibacter sp. PPCGB 2223]|uniref:class I SAM-dependent methyltransferase n=1 Tax=Mucilaginibacter sp. PPCGB 2223 TaxID=1886027 RepID=UPI000825EAB0|nr:class I SAM-dependent methyltransferase [Mucilaginibacter sp. PPCGB 2223]OCX53991.1 methyltransferase type 11 [Mucilaginibacter sp. PPCGB 2223]
MAQADSTQRFSNRVNEYIKYRPGYPVEVIDFLTGRCTLKRGSLVADVGSGTGIFSKLLLDKGYIVYGVEPNEPMQLAAVYHFRNNAHFIPVYGIAEATTLPANFVDLVVCAQAYHWFRPDETRAEFKRILKNNSNYVALIWNNRLTRIDAFARAYELLLEQKATDYREVNHQHLKGVDFDYFYKDGEYSLTKFSNKQVFDAEGLAGRAFSSSYVPPADTSAGREFALLLQQLFDAHQVNGRVTIYYETEVYLGKLS